MRNFSIFLLVLILLTGCVSPANAPGGASTPTSARPQATQTTSLGKCTNIRAPTPNPNEPSLFPKVSKQDHVSGPETADVTVIEYADFQCVGCAKLEPVLANILKKYPERVRLVYRHFPLLNTHDKSALATQASEAAALQGKFWEMHHLLYGNQAEWAEKELPAFETWLGEQAKDLGLDVARFQSDLKSQEIAKITQDAWQTGNQIGLPGAPLLIMNGEILKPPYVLANIENLALLYALPARQFGGCPEAVIDPAKKYTATLQTSKGEIVIRLFADKTPNTVNNFVFLAQQGWFDNIPFHHVLSGLLAQTGDPSGTGLGNPGYFISSEIVPGLKFDRAGMVGMANTGPDTNGSQFFITYGPAEQLNGKYPVFGEVLSGMEVLNQLTPRDPSTGGDLPEADMLLSVTVTEQ